MIKHRIESFMSVLTYFSIEKESITKLYVGISSGVHDIIHVLAIVFNCRISHSDVASMFLIAVCPIYVRLTFCVFLQIFSGNYDAFNLFTNDLTPVVYARCVRIKPTQWHNGIRLKLKIIGC